MTDHNSKIHKLKGDDWDIISKGKYFSGNKIWVKYAYIPQNKIIKLAIAVSKKYGNSVKRNKFKRRTKEAVRAITKEQPFLNSYILLIGTKSSGEIKFEEIENDISYLVRALENEIKTD